MKMNDVRTSTQQRFDMNRIRTSSELGFDMNKIRMSTELGFDMNEHIYSSIMHLEHLSGFPVRVFKSDGFRWEAAENEDMLNILNATENTEIFSKSEKSEAFHSVNNRDAFKVLYPAQPDVTGDVILCDPALLHRIVTAPKMIFSDDRYPDIFYGNISTESCVCVVGPLRRQTLYQDRLREYMRLHHASHTAGVNLPLGSFSRLKDVLILIARLLDAENFPASENDRVFTDRNHSVAENARIFMDRNHSVAESDRVNSDGNKTAVAKEGSDSAAAFQTSYYLHENSEDSIVHTPYELESRGLKAVEDGDAQEFYRILAEIHDYSGGRFAANAQKYMEYSTVSMVTLLTRAAIRGGVPQNEAYAISDLLLNRASRAKPEEQVQVLEDAVSQFLQAVRKYKGISGQSYHIRKCKAYIAANLNQPLSPEILAGELGLNKNYLMTLFSSYEGIPLMQYVMKKRIEAAADLLVYSDQPILRIANYYRFQTQSHFGVVFRKYMRMTPAAYRRAKKPVG